MKKLLALLLVVLMTLGLMLGCAKTQTEMAAMSDESTEAPAAVEPSSTTTEAEPVTITFAEHVADIENQEAHLAKIIDAFEAANPNITVEITGREVSEHNTQMALLAGENNLPDILWLEQASAQEFAKNGYLYDLSAALDQYGINDSLLPGLVHCCTVDSKDYGMPSEIMMVGFFYNKAIFEQNGLTVPTTYEEFMNVVKTLTDNGVTPIAI